MESSFHHPRDQTENKTYLVPSSKKTAYFLAHLVIVRELLAPVDPPGGEDDDVGVRDVDGLGDAVGVAAVVDVPGHAPGHGGVHHPVIVQPEHVDASVLVLVVFLPHISQTRPRKENNQILKFK